MSWTPPSRPESALAGLRGGVQLIEEREAVVEPGEVEQPLHLRPATHHGERNARPIELVNRLDHEPHAAGVQERHGTQIEHHALARLAALPQRRPHLLDREQVELAARGDHVSALDCLSAHAEGGRPWAHVATLQMHARMDNR